MWFVSKFIVFSMFIFLTPRSKNVPPTAAVKLMQRYLKTWLKMPKLENNSQMFSAEDILKLLSTA